MNMSVPEIVTELSSLRERRCKMRKAAKAGHHGAEGRLKEIEPEIQGHLDMLNAQGMWAVPYMGCDHNPIEKKDDGESATTAASQDARDLAQLSHPSQAQLQPAPALAIAAEKETGVVALAASAERHEIAKSLADAKAFALAPGKLKGWARFWVVSASIVFELALVLCCACFYDSVRLKTAFPQDKGNEDPELGFGYSLFGCFNDMRLCLFGCCCLPIRWADTMDKANDQGTTISYWPALLLILTFWLLNMLVGSAAQHPFLALAVGIMMVVVYTICRQKLRKRYQLTNGNCYTFTEDFLAWLCCPCCAAVQEARHVEAALQSKVAVPAANVGFGPEVSTSTRRQSDEGY
jgi:Cys-rich protein (TIGR01571 family)